MTEGQKMIWASTYSLCLHQWHLDGQPTDFSSAILYAIDQATGAVETLVDIVDQSERLADGRHDYVLTPETRKIVKDFLK